MPPLIGRKEAAAAISLETAAKVAARPKPIDYSISLSLTARNPARLENEFDIIRSSQDER